MNIAIPTGTFDIIPEDKKDIWRSSYLWRYVEDRIREHAQSYGFEEIRTPIFERAELFIRGVGDTSDIVSKEMYLFEDKGGRKMALRPEGTAPVIRSFIEKRLYTDSKEQRLYYLAPMFRYERPQAGRYRQHHQFGVEVFGSKAPEVDAEIIEMCFSLYKKLGMSHLTVAINSLGDTQAREAFREAFQEYLRPHYDALSKESQNRFEKNPLRIFDSKDAKDQEIIQNAPTILDFLSPECRARFERVQEILTYLEVPFEVRSHLVRGLDYYTNTVFEIISGELGAQNSVGGGGRFDGLVKELGGPQTSSIGFGTGIERILQTLIKQKAPLPERPRPDLYLIPLGEKATLYVSKMTQEVRQSGFFALCNTGQKKLKSSMQQADASRARYSLVLGDREVEEGKCKIKDMDKKESHMIELNEVSLFLKMRYTHPTKE